MKFGKDITINVNLLEQGLTKKILEIKFIGIHDHSWYHGKDIREYIKTAVEKHEPNAIILNYLKYQYSFGNELWDTIITPIMNLKKNKMRLGAIIADGSTMKSIYSLLLGTNIEKVCDIVLLTDKAEALEHLRSILKTA